MGSDNNERRFCVRCACVGCVSLFVTGNIIQTFLVGYGVPGEQVSRMIAAFSAAQMIAMFMMSLVADSLIHLKRCCTAVTGLLAVYFIVLTPPLLAGAVPQTLAKIMLAAGILQSALLGALAILDCKLPYCIIDMRNYARLSALGGLSGSILQVCAATLAAYFLARFRIGGVMAALFAGCAALVLIAALMTVRLRDNGTGASAPVHGGFVRVLRMPAFWVLLTPNLMRGICTGVINMLTVIGMQELGVTTEHGASMAIIYTAMSIAGAILFGLLSKRLSSRLLCLLAGFVLIAALPGLLLTGGGALFMALYAVVLGAMFMVDYSVPVIVTEIVPYDCIGRYSSLRLGAHWAGIALGSALVGFCLSRGLVPVLLAGAAAMQAVSGLVYYLFSRKAQIRR